MSQEQQEQPQQLQQQQHQQPQQRRPSLQTGRSSSFGLDAMRKGLRWGVGGGASTSTENESRESVVGSTETMTGTAAAGMEGSKNDISLKSAAYAHASRSMPNLGREELLVRGGGGGDPSTTSHYSMRPEDYELLQVIGHGSSATVYLAHYKIPLPVPVKPTVKGSQQHQLVSVKVIDLDMFERNQIDELRRELQIMTLSRHPNLLTVHGSFVNGTKLFIVTPFLSAGSGLDIMRTAYQNGMEEAVIATILKQVLQGLEYLHAHGLIHRDVKAGNLLVNNDGLVQLGDFGVSSSLTDHGSRGANRRTFVGTPCWMSPEVMDQSGYDYKADIWSFGITALELAYGHAPYAKFPPMKVLVLTLQNPPPTLELEKTAHKYSKIFKEMIDSCLQKDPSKRPSAEKLMSHPFFKHAKKPSYLVSTLLNGLTPITERAHLQQNNPQQQQALRGGASSSNNQSRDNQSTVKSTKSIDWDFNDKPNSAKYGPIDIFESPKELSADRVPRAVKFDSFLPERRHDDSYEFLPLERNSSSSSLSLQNTPQNTPSVMTASSTNAETQETQDQTVNSLASVFGNQNPAGSLGRYRSVSSPAIPLGSQSLPRKSRFVVESNAFIRPERSSSIESSGSSGASRPSESMAFSLGSSSLPSSHEIRKGRFSVIDSAIGGVPTSPSSPTMTSNIPGNLSEDNSLDRKAGRFAYHNISHSESETDGASKLSSERNLSPPPLLPHPSRFMVVDSLLDTPAFRNAVQALSIPLPTTETAKNTSDSDLVNDLIKQNDHQRVIIQDLLALLRSASTASSSPISRTTSPIHILPPPSSSSSSFLPREEKLHVSTPTTPTLPESEDLISFSDQ